MYTFKMFLIRFFHKYDTLYKYKIILIKICFLHFDILMFRKKWMLARTWCYILVIMIMIIYKQTIHNVQLSLWKLLCGTGNIDYDLWKHTLKPLIKNTSEEFIKCRLDNFSMSFILYYVNFSICENKWIALNTCGNSFKEFHIII